MNAPVRIVEQHARHRFTADEVAVMAKEGIIDSEANIELLDGDLIDMPSEGELHFTLKTLLTRFLNRSVQLDLLVGPDGPLHLSPTDVPEPDIYIFDAGVRWKPINPADVRLVIEISDTSLAYDLGRKSSVYAAYDIAEYWVIDVRSRRTHVLREPTRDAYHELVSVAFDQPLTPLRLPGISLVIAGLPGLKLDEA